MEPKRTKNSYDTYLSEFSNEIILECINCGASAILKNKRIICEKCGFNKILTENSTYSYNLWFSMDCCGEELWAYNRKHLNFLKEHVEATLRERNDLPFSNKSLGSRLPKWMTSSKNRENVLKAIEKLNNK